MMNGNPIALEGVSRSVQLGMAECCNTALSNSIWQDGGSWSILGWSTTDKYTGYPITTYVSACVRVGKNRKLFTSYAAAIRPLSKPETPEFNLPFMGFRRLDINRV